MVRKKKCNTLHYSVDFFSQNECNVYNARLYWLNCKMIMKWYLNVHCILVNQLLNCLCSVCTCTLTSSSENEAPFYIVLFSGLIHIQIFLGCFRISAQSTRSLPTRSWARGSLGLYMAVRKKPAPPFHSSAHMCAQLPFFIVALECRGRLLVFLPLLCK